MEFLKNLKVKYQEANKKLYSGKISEHNDQYWHEKISISNISDMDKKSKNQFGIIGYACDEGVKRNLGRIGAKNGPDAVRRKLGKLPIHFKDKKITDFGDIICTENNLEDCQIAYSKTISRLIYNNHFTIGIGGGHDIAYATFNGIKNGVKNSKEQKIGIINFDAHFDLRTTTFQPNSGTPFHQILSENRNVTYLAIGIQQQSNTKELFETAREKNVSFITNLECETFSKDIKSKLTSFLAKIDLLYITIDLDGFSSAYAPGVSATSPFGLSPNFVHQALVYLLKSKKTIACDIAELNPIFDQDEITAQLAAKLIDCIIVNA